MEFRLYLGLAGWATGDDGHSQQEVEYKADAAGHEDHNDPEEGTHGAPRSVAADVAGHESVEGGKRSGGDGEIDAHADRRAAVVEA